MEKILKRNRGFDYNKKPKPNIEMVKMAVEIMMLRMQIAVLESMPKIASFAKVGSGIATFENTDKAKILFDEQYGVSTHKSGFQKRMDEYMKNKGKEQVETPPPN